MKSMQIIALALLVALSGLACDRNSKDSGKPASGSARTKAPCLPCRGHEIAVTAQTPRCEHEGKTYYFCSDGCRTAFQKSPEKYLPQPATRPAGPTTLPFAPVGGALLPNAHRVTATVFSGGQPEGEEAFKTLQALGVRTIIYGPISGSFGNTSGSGRARDLVCAYVRAT